jgi:hypothetical protein
MKEQILEWCRTLAKSQGFYGRLLEELENDSMKLNDLVEDCQVNQVKDIVDFVMFMEN